MGRPCRVCNHERAADIGRDLLHGVSYRAIAKQYGVAIAGLSRHVVTSTEAAPGMAPPLKRLPPSRPKTRETLQVL